MRICDEAKNALARPLLECWSTSLEFAGYLLVELREGHGGVVGRSGDDALVHGHGLAKPLAPGDKRVVEASKGKIPPNRPPSHDRVASHNPTKMAPQVAISSGTVR